MNLQNKLDQFRDDNPYDYHTQAKRLLAKGDNELILYVLALGFATAKQRQRHLERDIIKNTGQAPPLERLVAGKPIIPPTPAGKKPQTIISGRASGTVTPIKIERKHVQNALERLIGETWEVGSKKLNDCNGNDLKNAEDRAEASANGQMKNKAFYANLRAAGVDNKTTVGAKLSNDQLRQHIEKVYGEFRTKEAA
jgi:hypothetical protein